MSKKMLSQAELLIVANERIRARPGFLDGMQIVGAEMVGNILTMHGECFFNADGGATTKTLQAIDFYNKFAHEFADEFALIV